MAEAGINGSAAGPAIPASADTLLRFQVGKKSGEPELPDLPVWLLAGPTTKLMRAYYAGLSARGLKHPTDDDLESEIRVWLDDMREAHERDPEKGVPQEFFDTRMRDMERYRDWKIARQEQARKDAEAKATALAKAQAEGGTADAEAEKAEPLARDEQLIIDRYKQLRRLASEGCPGVQAMEKQREAFSVGYPKVACAVALRGAEGVDFAVDVVGTEASAASLAHIADDDQQAIGLFWLVHQALTAAQKKTSDSAPPSPTIPTTTPEPGGSLPSSTDAPAASPRSRRTRSGTKPLTSTPAG